MRPECGDKLVNETKLKNGAILQRVINRAGVPYSLILEDGKEIYSTPTENEKKMLKWYEQGEK